MKHLKRIVTALSTAAIMVTFVLCADVRWFWALATVFAAFALLEYGQLVSRRMKLASAGGAALFAVGAAVLLGSLYTLPAIADDWGNKMLLYVIAIVKVSDMGGFAFGVAFGRRKLCPSVSPNKTWEGLGGSVFVACVVSCAFLPVTHFAVAKAIALGIVAALVGTAGDLVESKFKRWAGVKDSATFMPAGLGGVLDMIDSLVFAPALIYTLL